ncbi:Glutamate-rich protein 6 [Trichoplax sp. H2]|nr:Glutamate-rich protein 6 [Trichoplax sp. H2]|eukprot:RDD47552.1 Glutamate-rich protein 6 [Trichoplax sp. H2]
MSRETRSATNQPFDDGKNVSNSALRRGPRRSRSHSVTFSLSSDNSNQPLKRSELKSNDSSTTSSRQTRSESIADIPEELINKDTLPQQSTTSRMRSKSYSNINDWVSNPRKRAQSISESKSLTVLPILDVVKTAQPSSPTIELVKGLDSEILDIIAKERSATPKQQMPKPVLPNIKPIKESKKPEQEESNYSLVESNTNVKNTTKDEELKEKKVVMLNNPEGKHILQRRHSEEFTPFDDDNASKTEINVTTRNAVSADGTKRKTLSSQQHRRFRHGDIRKPVVSFKPQTFKIKREHGIVNATYNEDRTKRTIEIQTDWSWMEDWKLHNLVKGGNALSDNEDSGSNQSPESRQAMQHRSLAEEALANVKVVDENYAESGTIPEEAFSRHNTPSSTISSQKIDSTSEISDAFGVLTMEFSSDSSDEDDNDNYIDNEQDAIAAVGPPSILKYNRESEAVTLRVDAQTPMTSQSVASFHSSIGDAQGDGICDYCGLAIIKEFPTIEEIETTPAEKLFCCPDYHQFVLYLHELSESKGARSKRNEIPDADADQADSDISDVEGDALINVSPHAPFKNRQARREAKERAQEKMRERERERQLANTISNLNYYAFARQIKTINYTLSSNRCLEEGWTVIPSPLPEDEIDPDEDDEKLSFMTELPSNLAFLQQKAKGNQLPIQKFYENGSLFLILLPDGTGSVFYPSGNVAIGISAHGNGLSYVVLEDAPLSESQKILALFNPSGHSCIYHSNNRIRLLIYPTGGEVADSNGTRKKKWNWDLDSHLDKNNAHIHAPPFQPICFAITKEVALRCKWQDKVYLSFSAQARSCKFNVGVKLKLIHPQQTPELSKAQKMELENEEFLNNAKKRIRKLLNKTQTTLRYPKSPRLEQLAPPRYLESDKQKHRPKHRLQVPKSTPNGRLNEDDNASVKSPISVGN